MLGRRARETALIAPLPKAFTRVDHEFQTKTDERLLHRLAQSNTAPSDASAPNAAIGADLLSELRERLQKYESRNTELELEHYELNKRLDDLWLEYSLTQDDLFTTQEDLLSSRATVRRLQHTLSELGEKEQAYTLTTSDTNDEVPSDYESLQKRITNFDRIVFTGHPDPVLKLDRHDQLGAWIGKIWNILAALHDYAEASLRGIHNGGVHQYLQNTPTGYHPYSAERHARGESEDVKTNPQFRNARLFPVPESVDHSRQVFMEAHFRIAQYGLISPRIHYLDHVKTDGKIYVGYIGKHLPTKQTN